MESLARLVLRDWGGKAELWRDRLGSSSELEVGERKFPPLKFSGPVPGYATKQTWCSIWYIHLCWATKRAVRCMHYVSQVRIPEHIGFSAGQGFQWTFLPGYSDAPGLPSHLLLSHSVVFCFHIFPSATAGEEGNDANQFRPTQI